MEYLNLLNSIVLSLCISAAVLGVPYAIIRKLTDKEKSSTYECGFHPFQSSRGKFHVHFYLVAILFLVFDLEIILLFPWSSGQLKYSFLCTSIAYTFLALLVLVYAYEWKKAGMDWAAGPIHSCLFPFLCFLWDFLKEILSFLWDFLTEIGYLSKETPVDPEEASEVAFSNAVSFGSLCFAVVGTIIWAYSNWEDLKHDLNYIYQTVLDKFHSFFGGGSSNSSK